MARLSEIMLSQENRPRVLKDCVNLLHDEVSHKTGLSGMAIKAGFGVLKKVKPTMVEEAMDHLLDDFVHKLEPMHTDFLQSGKGVQLEQYLHRNSHRVADTLLQITDERAKHSPHTLLKGTYDKLRPMAVKQIQEAMPGVARLLKKYI